MLEVLAYPFRLTVAKPWLVLGSTALIFVALFTEHLAIQGPSPSLDLDIERGIRAYALQLAMHGFGLALLYGAVSAPLVVVALHDVGLRTQKFGLIDVPIHAVATILPTTMYGLVQAASVAFVLPFAFSMRALLEGQDPYFGWAQHGVPFVAIPIFVYLYIRMWLGGVAALRDRTLGFVGAWRATRRQVWRSFTYALVLFALAQGIRELVEPAVALIPWAPVTGSWHDRFHPLELAYGGLIALADTLVASFAAVASVFAFAKLLSPRLPSVTH